MCALFGGHRDISLFRHLNRELLHDIITQQVAFYKHKLEQTKTNIYGEAAGERYYVGPILFNCVIERQDQSTEDRGNILGTTRKITFKMLRDDLVDGSYVPEVGDVCLYEESYYEIHNLIENQYFVGKNPDYPNSSNPLNPGLENFGYNQSIICECHQITGDQLIISEDRIV